MMNILKYVSCRGKVKVYDLSTYTVHVKSVIIWSAIICTFWIDIITPVS